MFIFTLCLKQEFFAVNASNVLLDSRFGHLISKVKEKKSITMTSIIFVGDVMLARDVETKMKQLGADYPFLKISEAFKNSYVFGNFEASIPRSHRPTPNFQFKFSVDSNNLESLVTAGFTHFSLANNHAFDFGQSGYLNSIQQLELRDFTVVGNPTTVSTSSVAFININSVSVGVLTMSAVSAYPQAQEWQAIVDFAKKKSDLQIVYIHWGDEYVPKHNTAQQNLAHELVDSGIDVVIGHHPHVVQDIESYKNGLIIYSLGNFVFDQYFNDSVQTGLMLKMVLGINSNYLELLPITTKNSATQPNIMTSENSTIFLENLAGKSSPNLSKSIKKGILGFKY